MKVGSDESLKSFANSDEGTTFKSLSSAFLSTSFTSGTSFCHAKLASAIRDPEWLAGELYSKALISQQSSVKMSSDMPTQGISLGQKVILLLNHVNAKLSAERKPRHLLRFCDVLDKQRTLKYWAKRIRAEYNHLERMREGQQHVESETDILESTTDWSSESNCEVEIDGTEEELGLIILGSQLLRSCWNIVIKQPRRYITRTCGRCSCHNRLRMLLAFSSLVGIVVLFALQKLALQEIENVYEMFHTRHTLRRQAYYHKTKSIVERMQVAISHIVLSLNKYPSGDY